MIKQENACKELGTILVQTSSPSLLAFVTKMICCEDFHSWRASEVALPPCTDGEAELRGSLRERRLPGQAHVQRGPGLYFPP